MGNLVYVMGVKFSPSAIFFTSFFSALVFGPPFLTMDSSLRIRVCWPCTSVDGGSGLLRVCWWAWRAASVCWLGGVAQRSMGLSRLSQAVFARVLAFSGMRLDTSGTRLPSDHPVVGTGACGGAAATCCGGDQFLASLASISGLTSARRVGAAEATCGGVGNEPG